MSRLEIILSATLTLSVLLNMGLFAYAKNVVSKLINISTELYDLGLIIDNFTVHLESVYEMEMFYGDETLEGLMRHTQAIIDEVEQFSSIYSLTTDLSDEEEGDELDEDTEEYEEELTAN